MPQYDMPSNRGASGATPKTVNTVPDPRLIEQLLTTLARISQRDLPDFPRFALKLAIEMGLIDNLYTPVGSDQWIIAWAEVEPWEDPRVPLAVWREVCADELTKAQRMLRNVRNGGQDGGQR